MKHIKLFEFYQDPSFELMNLVKQRNMTYEFEDPNRNGDFELKFGYHSRGEGGTGSKDERYKIIISDDHSETPYRIFKGDKELSKESTAEDALNQIKQ